MTAGGADSIIWKEIEDRIDHEVKGTVWREADKRIWQKVDAGIGEAWDHRILSKSGERATQ